MLRKSTALFEIEWFNLLNKKRRDYVSSQLLTQPVIVVSCRCNYFTKPKRMTTTLKIRIYNSDLNGNSQLATLLPVVKKATPNTLLLNV